MITTSRFGHFCKLDLLTLGIVTLAGLIHLPYPFGGDQALFTIYALKLNEDRGRPAPERVPPHPTPSQEPLSVQRMRANEADRGRRARGPFEIPWRGWKDILLRTYREILDDRLFALAGGVAFYSLLALFPAIAAGVSSYALFANAGTIAQHLSTATDVVPTAALDIVTNEITRIAEKSEGKLSLGFALGLAIALWSANAGVKSIFDALNIIYDEQEKRGLIAPGKAVDDPLREIDLDTDPVPLMLASVRYHQPPARRP